MSGLFSIFNIATRGLNVEQDCLSVTSHNISNTNNPAYTRQRALVEASSPASMDSITSVKEPGQLGTGAQVESIQRIRDKFLDYQIRNEDSKYASLKAQQGYLNEMQGIFNEPSDTGLSTITENFFNSWQQLSKEAQSSNAKTIVAQQALTLTNTLNSTYNQLQNVKSDAGSIIRNSVSEVNKYINQIDDLNKEIIDAKATGSNPNDLMDKRDYLIDQLSKKFNLVVDNKKFDGINLKPKDTGAMLLPNLVNSDDTNTEVRFSYVSSIEKVGGEKKADGSEDNSVYRITYYKFGDMQNVENKQTITVKNMSADQLKDLSESRMLWANKDGVATRPDTFRIANGETIDASNLMVFKPSSGEIQGCMQVEEDVDKYCAQLDRFAKSLTFSVNTVLSGTTDVSKITEKNSDGLNEIPLFVNKNYSDGDIKGSDLKTATNLNKEESQISAANITINKSILDNVTLINTGKTAKSGDADGSRALAVAQLQNTIMSIQDIPIYSKYDKEVDPDKSNNITRANFFGIDTKADGTEIPKGTTPSKGTIIIEGMKSSIKFDADKMTITGSANGMTVGGYFKDTIDRLGVKTQGVMNDTKNEKILLKQLGDTRKSVSGVSLDDEMANLIKFRHAYAANAKVVATVNELLDVVINGLIR